MKFHAALCGMFARWLVVSYVVTAAGVDFAALLQGMGMWGVVLAFAVKVCVRARGRGAVNVVCRSASACVCVCVCVCMRACV